MSVVRPPWKVFLSHTRLLSRHPDQGHSYVAAAERAIARAGHRGYSLLDDTADARPAVDFCRDELRTSDVLVLLAGFQYGSQIEGDVANRSYTEFEFAEAGAMGKRRLVFLLDEDTRGGPRELYVDDDPSGRQDTFRKELTSAGGVTTTNFRSPDELYGLLLQALERLEKQTEGAPPVPERRPDPDPPPEPVEVSTRAPSGSGADGGPDRGEPPVTGGRGGAGSGTPGPRGGASARRRPVLAALVLLVVAGLLATVAGVACNDRPVAVPEPTAACPPFPNGQAPVGDGTLRIGSILPQTGPLSLLGPALRAATRMAVQDVENGGGVPGGVTLADKDQLDEGDPTTPVACEALGSLLSRTDAIVGPVASASADKMIQRVVAAHGVLVAPGTTAPELGMAEDDGRYFRTAPSDLMQGRIFGDLVAGEGGKHVVVIARDDTYGSGISGEVVKELKGLGIQDVRLVPFTPKRNPEDTEFGPAVDAVVGQETDAVVAVGFDEIGWLLRDLARRGVTPQQEQRKIYATNGFLRDTYQTNPVLGGPGLVNGLRGSRPRVDANFKKVLTAWAGVKPSFQDYSLAPHAYDAVVIIALAAVAAKSNDPRMFADKINEVTRAGTKCYTFKDCRERLGKNENIDYDGVSGPLDFTVDGEPCQGQYSVEQYDGGGNLQEYGRAFGNYLCTGLLAEPPK